jgi:hypothetical protein
MKPFIRVWNIWWNSEAGHLFFRPLGWARFILCFLLLSLHDGNKRQTLHKWNMVLPIFNPPIHNPGDCIYQSWQKNLESVSDQISKSCSKRWMQKCYFATTNPQAVCGAKIVGTNGGIFCKPSIMGLVVAPNLGFLLQDFLYACPSRWGRSLLTLSYPW